MTRLVRMGTMASALALVLPLAACSSFDPSDILDNIMSSQKKPLVGDRKPLFPDGTPGVQQGLPADLVKGYKPPAEAPPSDSTATAATSEEPKAKPKPKPKPKVVAAPPPADPQSTPASAAAGPAQASPWPGSPTSRSAPGQVAWPDPPPVTR